MLNKCLANNNIEKYQVKNDISIYYSSSELRKNEEMKNNEDDVTLNTKLQLEREPQANNNMPNDRESSTNDDDTNLKWITKKYQIDNDIINPYGEEWFLK